jgi:hypothetical protein
MNFKDRKLTIGFKEKERFDAEAVKKALQDQKFADVELLSGPE